MEVVHCSHACTKTSMQAGCYYNHARCAHARTTESYSVRIGALTSVVPLRKKPAQTNPRRDRPAPCVRAYQTGAPDRFGRASKWVRRTLVPRTRTHALTGLGGTCALGSAEGLGLCVACAHVGAAFKHTKVTHLSGRHIPCAAHALLGALPCAAGMPSTLSGPTWVGRSPRRRHSSRICPAPFRG